jgi:hypothetical protein
LITLPDITIAITTLDRLVLLKETLERFERFLKYLGGVRYCIGNDGEVEPLARMIATLPFADRITVIGDGTRKGLGANTNRILMACQTDIALQTQDDYFLMKPIDITPHVKKLLADPTAGWIRLKLLNGQDFTATVDDKHWRVSWYSESLYIASDQPHLKRWREWHAHYGFYAEGLRVADTENEWVGRSKQIGQTSARRLDVLIPIEWPHDTGWLHVGDESSLKDRGF